MIPRIYDWLERRDVLTRRTINGVPAHHRYKGRPRALRGALGNPKVVDYV